MASNNDIRLQKAVHDVQTGVYPSIRAAAAANNVCFSTLARRLRGSLPRRRAHEDQQLLSSEHENILKRLILDLEGTGHPVSPEGIRSLVAAIVSVTGGPKSIGQHWISRFLKRHPEIGARTGVNMEETSLDAGES